LSRALGRPHVVGAGIAFRGREGRDASSKRFEPGWMVALLRKKNVRFIFPEEVKKRSGIRQAKCPAAGGRVTSDLIRVSPVFGFRPHSRALGLNGKKSHCSASLPSLPAPRPNGLTELEELHCRARKRPKRLWPAILRGRKFFSTKIQTAPEIAMLAKVQRC